MCPARMGRCGANPAGIEDAMNLDQIMQQGVRWAEDGRPVEALECWAQVVDIASEVGYYGAVATAFTNMGVLHMGYKGQEARAAESFHQAMEYTDDPEQLAAIKLNLGVLATRKAPRDDDAARQHFEFAKEHGAGATRRLALQNLARLES